MRHTFKYHQSNEDDNKVETSTHRTSRHHPERPGCDGSPSETRTLGVSCGGLRHSAKKHNHFDKPFLAFPEILRLFHTPHSKLLMINDRAGTHPVDFDAYSELGLTARKSLEKKFGSRYRHLQSFQRHSGERQKCRRRSSVVGCEDSLPDLQIG